MGSVGKCMIVAIGACYQAYDLVVVPWQEGCFFLECRVQPGSLQHVLASTRTF